MTPTGRRPNWFKLAVQWLRRPRLDPLDMIAANRAVIGFNLIWLWDRIDSLRLTAAAMLEAVDWDRPAVTVFPFEEAPAAMARLQSGQTVGKVVLLVSRWRDAGNAGGDGDGSDDGGGSFDGYDGSGSDGADDSGKAEGESDGGGTVRGRRTRRAGDRAVSAPPPR